MASSAPSPLPKKGGIFSSSSARLTASTQGIGYSPNTPPATSGIPAFRSLRSLLPFGSTTKNLTPNASFSPNTTSKSPFSGFGSARRSLQKDRERKPSVSSDVWRPVITIDRNSTDDGPVRRSVSFSDLEPAVDAPSTPRSAFALRTPSPGPPLSIELSTIIEADNSGVSKNPPSARSSSPPVKPLPNLPDTSTLDLSTAHVADQVRNAILSSDSSAKQWHKPDKAVLIIDADADAAFDLHNTDPQLVALLSPNSLKTTSPSLLRPPPTPSSTTRLPRARQASSFLPRLRPPTSPSTTPPIIAIHRTDTSAPPSPLAPTPSRRNISLSGKLFTPDHPNTEKGATTTTTSKEPGRTLRRVVLGMSSSPSTATTPTPSPTRVPTSTFGRASLDSRRPATASEIGLGRPSLEIRRGTSFDSRRRPSPTTTTTTFEPLSSTASERTESGTTAATTPNTDYSPEIPDKELGFQRRCFADSAARRPSLDSGRPSSRMACDSSSVDRLAVPRAPRSRKRSMSVQERVGMDTNVGLRPGSSLSVGRPSRGGGAGAGAGGSGPKLEWLGPRTIKAFRAAGLLDPDRDKGGKERDASSSPVLGSNPSAPNRFPSVRTERTHSRMAYSEAAISRRGSESYSGNGNVMESPTLTGSSGSRGDRDTPRSASTALTSLSDTFGYFGREDTQRDRDRDREKEEMRELRERHATEVAALLGALSDSQRTVRLLRDENAELRERMGRYAGVVEMNQELRLACADLERECRELGREYRVGLRTPLLRGMAYQTGPKLAGSSPLAMDSTPFYEEEYNDTVIIHDSIDNDDDDGPVQSPMDDLLPSCTSTPSANRRLSNTSSIFPAPPANMTMLLDDEALLVASLSNRSSADQLHYGSPTPAPSMPLPLPFSPSHSHSRSPSTPKPIQPHSHSRSSSQNLSSQSTHQQHQHHGPTKSIGSGMSISPTTADFSIVAGGSSPRSLFLKPEHELLLGDMESLDLGVVPPIEIQLGKDDW